MHAPVFAFVNGVINKSSIMCNMFLHSPVTAVLVKTPFQTSKMYFVTSTFVLSQSYSVESSPVLQPFCESNF